MVILINLGFNVGWGIFNYQGNAQDLRKEWYRHSLPFFGKDGFYGGYIKRIKSLEGINPGALIYTGIAYPDDDGLPALQIGTNTFFEEFALTEQEVWKMAEIETKKGGR
jgi:hypothetical protein